MTVSGIISVGAFSSFAIFISAFARVFSFFSFFLDFNLLLLLGYAFCSFLYKIQKTKKNALTDYYLTFPSLKNNHKKLICTIFSPETNYHVILFANTESLETGRNSWRWPGWDNGIFFAFFGNDTRRISPALHSLYPSGQWVALENARVADMTYLRTVLCWRCRRWCRASDEGRKMFGFGGLDMTIFLSIHLFLFLFSLYKCQVSFLLSER